MWKLIILITISIACKSVSASDTFADYDVDWPPSGEPGIHLLVITIDGCATKFKVKNEDFYKFANSGEALTQALKRAIERAGSGCSN